MGAQVQVLRAGPGHAQPARGLHHDVLAAVHVPPGPGEDAGGDSRRKEGARGGPPWGALINLQ